MTFNEKDNSVTLTIDERDGLLQYLEADMRCELKMASESWDREEIENCLEDVLSIRRLIKKLEDYNLVLTAEELKFLYIEIDCFLLDVIRRDEDIDNLNWAKFLIELSEYGRAIS